MPTWPSCHSLACDWGSGELRSCCTLPVFRSPPFFLAQASFLSSFFPSFFLPFHPSLSCQLRCIFVSAIKSCLSRFVSCLRRTSFPACDKVNVISRQTKELLLFPLFSAIYQVLLTIVDLKMAGKRINCLWSAEPLLYFLASVCPLPQGVICSDREQCCTVFKSAKPHGKYMSKPPTS